MAKKTRIERAQARLVRQAENFCDADNEVQEARNWRRKLRDSHDPFDEICLTKFKERSQFCKYCIDFLDNSPSRQDALYKRRTAKSNMKRAYKELLEARSEGS